MPFHPRFSYTDAMVRNLGIIESARAVVEVLPLPPDRALWLHKAVEPLSSVPNKPSQTRLLGDSIRQLVEIVEDRFFYKTSCGKSVPMIRGFRAVVPSARLEQ